MYNPSGSTCVKRKNAETACTPRARVPAKSGKMQKPHVQLEREYLRKARKSRNRTYTPGGSTCVKRGGAEAACTTRAEVPAESGKMQKPHVHPEREYLRKAEKCRSRMYNSSGSTCVKWKDAETTCTNGERVHAKRGDMQKAHVQFERKYLRKEERSINCMYRLRASTCEKRKYAETTCTPRERVPA